MRLKELREDKDIKQTKLAELLNVRQNTYSQYENGQRQIPLDALIKVADFFNVSIDYILERTNDKQLYKK